MQNVFSHFVNRWKKDGKKKSVKFGHRWNQGIFVHETRRIICDSDQLGSDLGPDTAKPPQRFHTCDNVTLNVLHLCYASAGKNRNITL